MSLNLITDAWIPVRRKDGLRVDIAPWQMADEALAFPDWPRPDLNIACLELLIGLVSLADPPHNEEEWEQREAPDPDRLREKLAAFAPAFDLLGDGLRFMQDLEAFEADANDPNAPDMLFIDSAGGQTARNNADLMVKRERYPALDQPLAAMALYTLQAHAPSGGAGNRTSMRGGGPMVTLIEPYRAGLWDIVWANVASGAPAPVSALPWTVATKTSTRGEQVFAHDAHPIESFFGMPRRLRLVADDDLITGVVQKPYGANYAGWEHSLTPHYRVKAGAELLPVHPRAGAFGYRNWLGIVTKRGSPDDTTRPARAVVGWQDRSGGRYAGVIVAGWAMDNMKPRDFVFSRAPLIDLPDERLERMTGLVEAAEAIAVVLRGALGPVLAEGQAREAAREAFFTATQGAFEARLRDLAATDVDLEAVARHWLANLKGAALEIFDALALPGLADRDTRDQAEIVNARRSLTASLAGYGKWGSAAFNDLGLVPPESGRKKEKAA